MTNPIQRQTNPMVAAPQRPFEKASILGKIARIILAIFLVIISLGLVLHLVGGISNLLDLKFPQILSEERLLSIKKEEPPVKHSPHPLLKESDLSHIVWDNFIITSMQEELSQEYPYFHPTPLLRIPTIFNINRLVRKDLNNPSLKEKTLFSYVLWYNPKSLGNKRLSRELLEEALSTGSLGAAHWVSILIDKRTSKILYFDSLAGYIRKDLIDKALLGVAEEMKKATGKDFKIKTVLEKAVQKGDNTCGAWVCLFLERYLHNRNADFSQLTTQDLLEFLQRHGNPSSYA